MTLAPNEGAGEAPVRRIAHAERRRTHRHPVEIPMSYRSTLRFPPDAPGNGVVAELADPGFGEEAGNPFFNFVLGRAVVQRLFVRGQCGGSVGDVDHAAGHLGG